MALTPEQRAEAMRREWMATDPELSWAGLDAAVAAAIREARTEEREAIRAAFWEELKGAGELWFPYSGEVEPEEAVQAAWDDVIAHVDGPRAAAAEGAP